MNKEYKIKGWVAKDEDHAVFFHVEKPHKELMRTLDNEKIGYWKCYNERFRLSCLDKMFPELTWDDEPIEVELTISNFIDSLPKDPAGEDKSEKEPAEAYLAVFDKKEHIDKVKAMKRFEEKSGSKKEYELSRFERDVVKELLHIDDNLLDSCTITKMDNGEISVSTSRVSWMSLSGREWRINVDNKTAKCVRMS